MKSDEDLIWESYANSITRGSIPEVKYYFDEIFDNGENLKFDKINRFNHPKFDDYIFTFNYNNKYFIKCFISAGVNASKSENGSMVVSAFVYELDIKTGERKSNNYIKHISNAFYNKEQEDVSYDPVIRNAKDALLFIKSGIEDDDGEGDDFNMPQNPPQQAKPLTKELVGV